MNNAKNDLDALYAAIKSGHITHGSAVARAFLLGTAYPAKDTEGARKLAFWAIEALLPKEQK